MNPAAFHPPYLRYDDPNEFAQIQAKIKELKDRADARKASEVLSEAPVAVSAHVALNFVPPATGTTLSQAPHAIETVRVPEFSAPAAPGIPRRRASSVMDAVSGAVVGRSPEALAAPELPAGSAAKAPPTFVVNVSPGGTVSMGFNCVVSFHVTNNLQCDDVYWYLYFKDPATGLYSYTGKFVGSTSTPTPTDEIMLDMDYSTYAVAAYQTPGGTAHFKVSCQGLIGLSKQPGPSAISSEVVLNFNASPCLSVYSIGLNENTFMGGNNGADPTMTVALDGPAPPGGQRVDLSVSNPNLGEIMGSDKFMTIPAGQTTGAISWFLGTRKVYSNRTFDIVVRASGSTYEGHATIYLKCK